MGLVLVELHKHVVNAEGLVTFGADICNRPLQFCNTDDTVVVFVALDEYLCWFEFVLLAQDEVRNHRHEQQLKPVEFDILLHVAETLLDGVDIHEPLASLPLKPLMVQCFVGTGPSRRIRVYHFVYQIFYGAAEERRQINIELECTSVQFLIWGNPPSEHHNEGNSASPDVRLGQNNPVHDFWCDIFQSADSFFFAFVVVDSPRHPEINNFSQFVGFV